MAKKIIPLPAVTRVAPSSVAFIEIPIGPTYETLSFQLTGTGLAASMIDNIKLIANGQELQTYLNLQQVIDINAYHGRAADTAADWCLHLANDDYNTLAEKNMEAFGSSNLQTLTLEISLNGTWPANGSIKAFALVDTVQQPLGVFNRIRQTVFNAPAVGDVEYDKIQRNGAVYKQIHFIKSDVNNVVLEADGVKIIDATKTVIERIQKNVKPFARIPQTAKMTTLDFVLDGYYGDLFKTDGMSDLRARLTVGSAGNIQIVTEQLDVFA